MENMTKKDLKTGMVVEYANGGRRVVLLGAPYGDILSDLNGCSWGNLGEYNNNLTSAIDGNLDIVKVLVPRAEYALLATASENYKLLWERKSKVVEITSAEAFEVLKRHYGGRDIKIVYDGRELILKNKEEK